MPGKPPFTIGTYEEERRAQWTGREPNSVGDYVSYAIEKVTLELDFVPDDIGYYMILAGGVGIVLTFFLSLLELPMLFGIFLSSVILLFVGHTADVLQLQANYGHKNSYSREWMTFIGFCIPLFGAGVIAYYIYKRRGVIAHSSDNSI